MVITNKRREKMRDPKTGMEFDDQTKNDPECSHTHWTQLCENHAVDNNDMCGDGCLCGIKGCNNKATHYYDFDGVE
jgi:hypothetical protein